MILEPIKDKLSGQPLTNVDVVRRCYKILTALKNSPNEQDQLNYSKAINNDENNYLWFKQIAEEENDIVAQKMIEKTLTSVNLRR